MSKFTREEKRWNKAVEIVLTAQPAYMDTFVQRTEEVRERAMWIYGLLLDLPDSGMLIPRRFYLCEEPGCEGGSLPIDFGGGSEYCARHLTTDWYPSVRKELGAYGFAKHFRPLDRPEANAIILADVAELQEAGIYLVLPDRLGGTIGAASQ